MNENEKLSQWQRDRADALRWSLLYFSATFFPGKNIPLEQVSDLVLFVALSKPESTRELVDGFVRYRDLEGFTGADARILVDGIKNHPVYLAFQKAVEEADERGSLPPG